MNSLFYPKSLLLLCRDSPFPLLSSSSHLSNGKRKGMERGAGHVEAAGFPKKKKLSLFFYVFFPPHIRQSLSLFTPLFWIRIPTSYSLYFPSSFSLNTIKKTDSMGAIPCPHCPIPLHLHPLFFVSDRFPLSCCLGTLLDPVPPPPPTACLAQLSELAWICSSAEIERGRNRNLIGFFCFFLVAFVVPCSSSSGFWLTKKKKKRYHSLLSLFLSRVLTPTRAPCRRSPTSAAA